MDNSEQFLPAPGLKWRCSSHLTLLLCLPACSHPTLHRHLFVFEWPSWAHNTHNEECWSELLTHCCHQHSVESVEKYFINAGQLFQLHSWGQRVTNKQLEWIHLLGFFSWIRINDLIFLFVSGITLFSFRIFSAPTGKNKLVTPSYSANASKRIFYSFTFHHVLRLFLCLWNNSPATQSRTGSSARILTKSQHDIIIMWQQMFMIKTLNLISFTYLQGEPEKTDENVTTVYSPFPLVFPCLEKLLFQLQLFFRTCGNHHHKYIRYYQCFHYSLFFITPHTFVPHRKHIHVQIRQETKIRKLQIIQGFKGLKCLWDEFGRVGLFWSIFIIGAHSRYWYKSYTASYLYEIKVQSLYRPVQMK